MTTTPSPTENQKQGENDGQGVLLPLTATQLRLIDEIAHLSKLHARTSPRGGRWCQPGRHYLAERTGRSIWTVSRAVCDPRFRRVVQHHQQRRRQGIWRTSKYYIIHRAAWVWAHSMHEIHTTPWLRPTRSSAAGGARITAHAPSALPRAPNRTHTSPVETGVRPLKEVPAALAAVLSRIEAKLKRNDEP